MKIKANISRIFGLFMLCVVMLNSITPANALPQVKVEQSQEDGSDKDQKTVLSEWSSAVVVPSNAFHFHNDVFIVPAISYEFEVAVSEPISSQKTLYRHTYFDKIFERHIAINAP